MRLNLKIYGFPEVEKIIGRKELSVEIDGITIADLERHLVSEYGPKMKDLFNSQILKNGVEWIKLGEKNHSLRDGDSLSFLNMITGG